MLALIPLSLGSIRSTVPSLSLIHTEPPPTTTPVGSGGTCPAARLASVASVIEFVRRPVAVETRATRLPRLADVVDGVGRRRRRDRRRSRCRAAASRPSRHPIAPRRGCSLPGSRSTRGRCASGRDHGRAGGRVERPVDSSGGRIDALELRLFDRGADTSRAGRRTRRRRPRRTGRSRLRRGRGCAICLPVCASRCVTVPSPLFSTQTPP